jgi:NADH dehydrogenase [ubiquinone] 1 alpha subcomplex assembly factor 5
MSGADIKIFDRALLRQRQARSIKNFSQYDFLHRRAQIHVFESLEDIKRRFPLALHSGILKPQHSPQIEHLLHMDMTAGRAQVIGDEELLPFRTASLDLVTSVLTLHTVNDLPGALIQIRRALKPDGLFLAAMAGGETLFELRECLMEAELQLKGGASPRVHPFADKQQMGALMQRAGFALPVIDSEIVTVTYTEIFKLMRDLRGMLGSNVITGRAKHNPGKALFREASKLYAARHADPDGRIRASFEIIYLLGWVPHDSQQQPLRPGSAQTRLADALGAQEIKTPDKAAP